MNKSRFRWEVVLTHVPKEEIEKARGSLARNPLLYRARIPGGWLVGTPKDHDGVSNLVYVPDPDHLWDGSTLGPAAAA